MRNRTSNPDAPVDPLNPLNRVEFVKAAGGASAVGVLMVVVWYLLTTTIPSIQKDSAEQRRVFEGAIQRIEERTAQRDAKIVDALLELKRDK